MNQPTSPAAMFTCKIACATCQKPLGRVVNATVMAVVETPDGLPVNVRALPSPDAPAIGVADPGAELPMIGRQNGPWVPVLLRGVAGWIRGDLVRLDSEAARTAPSRALCPEHFFNTNIALAWEEQAGVVALTPPAPAAPPVPPVPTVEEAMRKAEKEALAKKEEGETAPPPVEEEKTTNGAAAESLS